MANITEEHLHHMARRHHATMKQLDGIRSRVADITGRFVGTIEYGAGSWLGGAIEGRTTGGTVVKIPINLGIGAILLAAGHLDLAGDRWSDHLNNIGNGFVGSYVAATGYAFGKRWRETGKFLGGGGHPWTSPYENGWQAEAPAPAVHGDLTEAQMAAIVQRMQAAAAAPAHP